MSIASSAGNYDRIARFYDVDMARNMRFDDIGFYASLCAEPGQRVLELGCGTGRILLPLLDRGIDIVGIDASAGMLDILRRHAATLGKVADVTQMDLRQLPLPRTFDVVLCPYSLVTYLTEDHALRGLLAAVAPMLRPRGKIVIDAFVPRALTAIPEFALDYERPFEGLMLSRWKKIASRGAINRIERRYRLTDAHGEVLEDIDVVEDIRPYAPETICGIVHDAGYGAAGTFWDYAPVARPDAPQFFTLVAELGGD